MTHASSPPRFRTILVAVDGSTHGDRALEAAIELAQHCESRLLLFHAVELGPMRADLDGLVDDAAREVYRRVGAELAERILDTAEQKVRAAGPVPLQRIAEPGNAAAAIVEAAQNNDVDLVVVGTRGLTGLHGLALGSVAHKVTSMAPCPVMVVR